MERELDEIKVRYLEAHEAGQAPTLEALVARYPQYRDELIDFVMTFLEISNALPHVPEVAEVSSATRRGREAAVRAVMGARPLRDTIAEEGLSRDDIAEAVNVPVSFILKIERGRLLLDGNEPVPDLFLSRFAAAIRRTVAEALEVLRTTGQTPPPFPQATHLRGTGTPVLSERPAPQSFQDLLATCPDLTPAQRREWLDPTDRH